jgi:hypothetical protein
MIKHKYFFNCDYFSSLSTIIFGLFGCDCTHKLLNQNSISYQNVIRVKSICHMLSKFENSSLLFHHDFCKTYNDIIGGGWLIIYGCSFIKWPWRPFIYIILCHFASSKPKYFTKQVFLNNFLAIILLHCFDYLNQKEVEGKW